MDKVASTSRHQHRGGQYVCNRCRKSFQLCAMYACNHGHYLCRSCYQKVNSDSTYNLEPNPNEFEINDERLAQTNNFLVQPTPFLARDQELGETLERKRMMFPNPGIYQQNTIDKHSSLISLATIYKPSLLNLSACSKKPIICPQYDCRKTIAVSSLDAHFYHEHKQVATIVTQLETRNCIEFNFKDLRGKNKNMCLVLITLENNDCLPEDEPLTNRLTSPSRMSHHSPRPFFILVASKMPNASTEDKSDIYENQFRSHERVFLYVTSNIVGNYSYTIAVSTPVQNVRIKYYGPLLSVNEDFRKLCDDGKGLILNHYLVNGLSDDCCCPVNLDLILHERDDQCFSEI